MDCEQWNARYTDREWDPEREANPLLTREPAALEPRGSALDLGCGEGRNAIWLAERGWKVTAVDFSSVALARARSLAERRAVDVHWIQEDVTRFLPAPAGFQLVVILYLQLPGDERRRVLERAASALSAGGFLFMVGHALRNLREGVGGPRDPEVLWEPQEIERELAAHGLCVETVDHARRRFESPEVTGDAVDLVVRARRPAAAAGSA